MKEFITNNFPSTLDGLFFGLGILAVYLGTILIGVLIRVLSGAGGKGLTVAGQFLIGWLDYIRNDDRNTVNATLNMIVDGKLKFDTLVADCRIWMVWTNAYRMHMIKHAARNTTEDDPVIHFNGHYKPGRFVKLLMRLLMPPNIIREDDYVAMYHPLISLIAERCNNDMSMNLSLGHPMQEHRYVIAVTFEQYGGNRARHLRAMVILESTLLGLTTTLSVDSGNHANRYRTLLAISRQYRANPERFGVVSTWRPM